MEEKTPVGSNAPIEESTEKKTSPAGSNSPSAAPIEESIDAAEAASADASTKSADAGEESAPAAPAGSNSPSAAPIEETSDVVDTASTDTGAESAPAGSSSASATPIAESAGAVDTASADEASAAEAAPDEEEDENAQWEAYEREQAEIEESRRKPGKYRWVMKQDDMREAMLALEKAKGRYRMYTIAAYVMCVFALVPAADFILTRSVFSMMAAFAAVGLGIWIKGITSRAARGAMKQMNPRGIKFSIEAKKHGLQVSDMVNKASLMPYSFFKAAYETEDYLSLVTVKNSALHIKRDEGSASYRALREKLQQELGEHFVSKKIQKNK
ncbi:MAG: hypothetical protein KHW56_00380 [Clostridiales bacterium]|nr:hypothetical protein [Clostridiales bacterium]